MKVHLKVCWWRLKILRAIRTGVDALEQTEIIHADEHSLMLAIADASRRLPAVFRILGTHRRRDAKPRQRAARGNGGPRAHEESYGEEDPEERGVHPD